MLTLAPLWPTRSKSQLVPPNSTPNLIRIAQLTYCENIGFCVSSACVVTVGHGNLARPTGAA